MMFSMHAYWLIHTLLSYSYLVPLKHLSSPHKVFASTSFLVVPLIGTRQQQDSLLEPARNETMTLACQTRKHHANLPTPHQAITTKMNAGFLTIVSFDTMISLANALETSGRSGRARRKLLFSFISSRINTVLLDGSLLWSLRMRKSC